MSRDKPLGHKSYGSIGHLMGSRMDVNHQKHATGKKAGSDFGVAEAQHRICTARCRKGDEVIVQEKLDGSNVAVANVNGALVPLSRAGRLAVSSPHEQHRMFAAWVFENAGLFDFLIPGERVCGEWLALAHGTVYRLPHGPFVAFDIIDENRRVKCEDDPTACRIPRLIYDEFVTRVASRFPVPAVLSRGGACSVEDALGKLDPTTHGAQEEIEGAVWRVERDGRVDFLAKYVRPSKVDGKYLPDVSGKPPIWNWVLPSWESAALRAVAGDEGGGE